MCNRNAYYAISGDPVTFGHLWVVQQAEAMFDHLFVALAVNPSKQYAFSFEERSDMLSKALRGNGHDVTITAINHDQFTVRAAKRQGASYVVRGVRNSQDFMYEMEMAHFNSQIEPGIQTIFLPTPRHLMGVSSSFVKGLVGLEDWEKIVAEFVPPVVVEYLVKRHLSKMERIQT